ncbi:hypothetical protein HDV06_001873 [Boothiomyces sp. JEL0866]|nr:hypothetical protein HDV06_001873 [Boothiomyces sp. JEL0866]
MTFGSMDSVAQRDSSILQEEQSAELENHEADVNIPRNTKLLDNLQAALLVSNPPEDNSSKEYNIGNLNNANESEQHTEQLSKRPEQKTYTYEPYREESSTPKLGGRNPEGLAPKISPIDSIKSMNDGSTIPKLTVFDKDESKQNVDTNKKDSIDAQTQNSEVAPSKKGLRGPANYKEGEGHSFVPKHRVNIRESRDDNHVEKVEKKKARNRGKSEADRLADFNLNQDMEDLLKQSDQSLHESEKPKYRVAPYTVTPPKSRARAKREDSDDEFNEQQPSSSKGDYGQESKRPKSGGPNQVIYGFRPPQDFMYQNTNFMTSQPQYLQDFMIQPTRQWMPMQQMMGNQPLITGQTIMNAPYGYAYYNPVDYEQKQGNEMESALPPLAPMPPKQGKANKPKKQSDSSDDSKLDDKTSKYNEKAAQDKEDSVDRGTQKISGSSLQGESNQTPPPVQPAIQPSSPTFISTNPALSQTSTTPVQQNPQVALASPVVQQGGIELKSQITNQGTVSSPVASSNPPTNITGSIQSQPPVQGNLPTSFPSQLFTQQQGQAVYSQLPQQTQSIISNSPIHNVSAQPVPIQLPQLQQITVQQTNPILPAQQQSNTPQFTQQQIAQAVPPIPPQVVQTYVHVQSVPTQIISAPTHTSEGSGITTSESEQLRLSAMYALGIVDASDSKNARLILDPRLNKITQMTAKLLGRTCCVLSLVDTDKVIWKSASYTTAVANPIKEEARYESFCSWVVQDESGRGITILDAKSDPRCTHMRIKPGLEFYAGVPIVIGIGALSIQGPPSSHISVIDMNILHEMAEWASCELDTIAQQNLLQSKEMKLDALNRLTEIKNMNIKSEREMEVRYIEKCLGIIKNALKASSVLLLKLTPDSKGFDCILQAYCNSGTVNATNLPIGEQMFHELAVMTLKKEPINQPLVLELKVGAVTKDVDHYLTKKINRVASEVVWTQGGPTGILAVFFEGPFRTVNQEDLKFIEKAMPIFSNIVESLEIRDSLIQASAVHKIMAAALKKFSLPFGSHQGLAPVLLVIEPVFTVIKGFDLVGNSLNQKSEKEQQISNEMYNSSTSNIAPKGQAHAQLLAKQLEVETLMGASSKPNIEPPHITNRKPVIDILPLECFDILNDFSQILDVLAEKFTLKRPKRISSQAQIGIHCDFTPIELGQDTATLKDQFQAMVNAAHKLEVSADTVLVSDVFYHQTKQICSYEAGPTLVLKGQGINNSLSLGLFSTYKLIGKCTEVVEAIETTIKENGINDKGSLIVSTMPQQQPTASEPPEGAIITGKIFPEITNAFTNTLDAKNAKKKEKKCTIL